MSVVGYCTHRAVIHTRPVCRVDGWKTYSRFFDRAMFHRVLRSLLEIEGDIEVVGEAKNGRHAVELSQKLRPAAVVMDLVADGDYTEDFRRTVLIIFPA